MSVGIRRVPLQANRCAERTRLMNGIQWIGACILTVVAVICLVDALACPLGKERPSIDD